MPSKFNPEKFYGKVLDLLYEEDYSGALKLLETVPQAHIKKNEHHSITALCYYYLNEEKKALDHLNKISSKDRKDPDYQYLKADCHYYLERDKDMDPAIRAYSNAIELYESDPKSLDWFGEKDMISARSKILSYRALKGINELNENNLKSVQESLDYIMEHHSDCMDEDSFGPTGVFLVKCSLSDEFSDRKEDYIDLSITSLEKAIKKCEKDSQDLPFYKNVLGWAYSLSGINAIEKGDISSIKRMAEKIIGMDLTLSDNYSAYLDIGTFLGSCYHIKDFLETDEQYLLNAQTFLSECQKSDVKDIKNSAILFLGMLSVEKECDIRNTIRGLKFDDEFLNDNYIFIQTLLDLDKKPQSVIRALNNLKDKQTIPELLINLILVIAYGEAKEKSKAKKLLTETKREDFPSAFYLLPVFDLACCVVLNSSEAKVHLEEWVEQYPDSERFKGYLSDATNPKIRKQFTNMIPIEDLMSFISQYMYSGDKQNIESKMLGSKKSTPIALKKKKQKHDDKIITSQSKAYKNHLILIPKYKTGNKCQNRFQWYDENGDLKEGKLTDDPFDLIYYVAWLDQNNKKNLYFSTKVKDEHIVEIMGEKHSFGPKARFNSNWAKDDKYGRLKGQRMSDINNKIDTETISRPKTSLIINNKITGDLIPFP